MCAEISVIIPVYNGESTIAGTLNSVLEQSYKSFELLVINDGSTDNTRKILDDYAKKDSRIKIINQKNAGVSVARNVGISKSSAKYISFLDADDIYHEKFIEKMLYELKSENADVCYCGSELIPHAKKNSFKKFTNKNVLINYIKGRLPTNMNTWLIKKSYLIENDLYFREGVSWGEDMEFFYNLLSKTEEITFVPEYLTYYRSHHSETQLSNFSLDKIDLDYNLAMRAINSSSVNKSRDIENALLQYRLAGQITNRLLTAIQKNYNVNEVKKYYEKYDKYIKKYEWSNGLRSLKLNIQKKKLKNKIRSID